MGNEQNVSKDNNMIKDIKLQFHKEFIENYRDSQNKIFQFLGFVVSAITIFGYAAWSFHCKTQQTQHCCFYPVNNEVLLIAYIVSQIILLVGIALILDAAYTFRRDQVIVYEIRENVGWSIYNNPIQKGFLGWIRNFYGILLIGLLSIQFLEWYVVFKLLGLISIQICKNQIIFKKSIETLISIIPLFISGFCFLFYVVKWYNVKCRGNN